MVTIDNDDVRDFISANYPRDSRTDSFEVDQFECALRRFVIAQIKKQCAHLSENNCVNQEKTLDKV